MSEENLPQPGDSVLYVPSESHAYMPDFRGEYPWQLGWKDLKGRVEELEGSRIREAVFQAKSDPKQRGNLVFIRPLQLWPATVRSTNEDGTLDLDIQATNGGVTLSYAKVPFTAVVGGPHTCHKAEGENALAKEGA